jgi:UPF0042 nucleotide-binding protein
VTEFAVITGLSGAGRSTAADVLEDQGWFVIDNLPVSLIPQAADLAPAAPSGDRRVAVVLGGSTDASELVQVIGRLRTEGSRVRVLFLDARTDVLIRRYETTRRRHPASAGALVGAAIEQERAELDALRAEADVVIDTSDLNVHQLSTRVAGIFGDDETPGMQVTLTSFGFKHGLPVDVDLVFDCRFLPNPHWVDELRPLDGRDERVKEHVLGSPLAEEFVARVDGLLEILLPAYRSEGKAYLTVAFGCTGGQHRSVAIAEELAHRLGAHGVVAGVAHRDVDRPA